MLTACGSGQKEAGQETENPFFTEYTTPFGVPPFDKIKFEHYKPAMMKGIEEGRKEIDAIVNNPEEPTFENTIVALDQQGALLRKVQIVFGGQNSVNTNDEMQALSREMSPILSKYNDDINLNPKLFARVKAVYDKKDQLGLDKEQMKLLEETYKDFVRGGANLSEADQAKLRELNSEISMLQLTFGQNMLKETNAFKLVIDKKEDLAGLPETLVANAAKAAEEAGMPGKWVFTLQNPSIMPFLQYADNRELREKIFKAYINRGNNNNENDNKEVVRKLVSARLAKAKEFGADIVMNPAKEDVVAKIKEMTDGYGCDIYIEATGHPSSVQQGLDAIRKMGRFVEFSVFGQPVTVDWSIISDRKELDLLGVHLSPFCYDTVIDWIGSGKLPTDGVVSHKFSLDEWEKGFELAKTGKDGAMKVVLVP